MSIHVFDSPETARGDRGLLRTFGKGHGGGGGSSGFRGWAEVHGGARKGPEESLEEGRHDGGADEAEDDEEELGGEPQVGKS